MSDSQEVILRSTSKADDLGLQALADVAQAADGEEYRIIGGHMVRLLRYVYDVPGAARLTADADAGVDEAVAAAGVLHDGFRTLGYEAKCGNRYVRGERAIDVLVPTCADDASGRQELGGRMFDGAPGVRFALSTDPIWLRVEASLTDASTLAFSVPVPDVEAAFVLKVLVWRRRLEDRDVDDLLTLMEIVHSGPQYLAREWTLDDPKSIRFGERLDAARAAKDLTANSPSTVPARLRALVHRYVAEPAT